PGSTSTVRQCLIEQVAQITRRLHAAHFFHNDLYWRNLLVTHHPPALPQIWCIDCPRGRSSRWSLFRQRRRLKDLYALDLSARDFCRRTERLRFLKLYLGKSRCDTELKNLACQLAEYQRIRLTIPAQNHTNTSRRADPS